MGFIWLFRHTHLDLMILHEPFIETIFFNCGKLKKAEGTICDVISPHTRNHTFTVQAKDAHKEGSVSSLPCPGSALTLKGRSESVSPSLQSATDSPSLERAVPPPATPASEPDSCADGLEASADDVFAAAEEDLSAPDSPQKEFHSAVLRALTRDPVVIDADQATGTQEEAESC